MITAKDVLSIVDREVKEVAIRGGTVYVRSLSAGEHVELIRAQGEASRGSDGSDYVPTLVLQLAAFMCNEDGEAILSAEQAEEFARKRHPDSLQTIVGAALSLNGWGSKSREEITGNS